MVNNLFKIGVSPRDNHLVHGMVCKLKLTAMAPLLSNVKTLNQKVLQDAELIFNHMTDHLSFAAQGVDAQKPEFIDLEKFHAGFGKQLAQVVAIQAQQKAATQAVISKIGAEGPGPTPDAPAPAEAPQPGGATPAAPGPDLSAVPGEGTGQPVAAEAA